MKDNAEKTSMPRILRGVVVSDKMKDTIVVVIERRVQHKLYGKTIRKRTKVHAHDAGNRAKMGDMVAVKECRPISKTKTWTLLDINTRAAS